MGNAGTTGQAGTTGAAGRGGAGGSVGSGGSAAGGRGGSGGGTAGSAAGTTGGGGSGGTGSATTPSPSAGCGKSGRPSGGKVEVSGQSLHYFPTTYDGTKPFPLLIALHACGNPNTEFVSLTTGNGLDTTYVRTFPNTPDSGQCWSNYTGDISRILSQYDDLMANYCIDKNRVFATAHSSGAQMLVNILSHKTDAQHLNLRGIAPVAADPYNVAVPMPVMYIDGKMDNQRSADSAKNTVAKFRAANMCADTSKPYTAVMMCNSTDSGRPLVDPGCIIYDNCTVPTIWCSHNDPSYSGTQHGVPCFAMKAMSDFFAGL
jgi:predicted esterase